MARSLQHTNNFKLHAPYEAEPNDSYICHRTAQAWEIAKLMRGASERGHLVLALGDFNMIPLSLAHRLISTHSPVRDVWLLLHPDSSLGAAQDPVEKARRRPIPTADFNVTENGATCDSVYNTWRWSEAQQKLLGPGRSPIEVPGDRIDPKAKRLDYIFTNTTFNPEHPGEGGWVVKAAKVGMLSRHPELQCSLSDHFSVETTLIHSRALDSEAKEAEESAMQNGAYLSSPTTSEFKSLYEQFRYNGPQFLPLQTYDEILAMIAKYRAREAKQRRYRLCHFGGWVVVSIGCLIAVWWSPKNYVSFILMLLSTFGLSAGVIDGLIGGLFVGSEIRALKEFEWEISNAKASASGDPHTLAEEGIKDW
jgi:sphingomyelin phosphodiesterase 2